MTSAFFACNSVIVVMLTLYALCKLVLTAQETTDSARIDEARSFGGVHKMQMKKKFRKTKQLLVLASTTTLEYIYYR